MRHFHTIPTVLEGDSLYEAYCRLAQYIKDIETETASGKVSKSGDIMDGTLNFKGINAGVTFTGDAANANGIAGAIDTETGAGSLVITGVKAPTAISDAATKGYVDAADEAIGASIDGIEEELEKKIGTAGGTITQGKLEFTGALSGIKFNTSSSNGIEGHISDQTGVGTTKITGIRNPVDPYDAATKEYVDNQIGSGKVSKTGDSMTGLLTLSGPQSGIQFSSGNNQGIIGAVSPVTGKGLTKITGIAEPLADYDVANKKYVDDATAGSDAKVSKDGDTMFGTLTFQESAEDPAASGIEFKASSFGIKGWASPQTGNGLTPITNVRTPVNDYDAATKKYVDEHGGGGEGKVDKAGDSMTGTLNMTTHNIEQVGTLTGGQVNVTSGIIGEAAINELSIADPTEYTAIQVNDNVYLEDANLSLGAGKLSFGRDSLGISGYTHPSQGGKLVITGVATPTSEYDAATKKYVDETAVTYAEGLTADLNANNQHISALGTPRFNYDAATKKYVDDNTTDKVSKTANTKQTMQSNLYFSEGGGIGWDGVVDGVKIYASNGTSVGELSCGDIQASFIEAMGFNNHNARVTGVGTPINSDDAATKGYVDSSKPLIINATKVGNTWTFDKTFDEVGAAGLNSEVHFTDEDGYTYRVPMSNYRWLGSQSSDSAFYWVTIDSTNLGNIYGSITFSMTKTGVLCQRYQD